MKTQEPRQCPSGIFIVNFEHISHLFLEFLLLTSNKQMLAGLVRSSWSQKNVKNKRFCTMHNSYPKLKDQ